MSQDTPANQDLEERQAPSQTMVSSNHLNIFGGEFFQVNDHGSVQRDSTHNRSGTNASMQASALKTIPGSVKGTIRIPRFSISLLLRDLSVDTGEPSSARLEGSCSYDLASSLRLLPGQENVNFAEYDEFPVDRAVSRGQCYCGLISRHGLIFLISRHLQDVTTAETTSGGPSIVVQTTFGRFKFYEQNDRPIVHFDRGTRSSNVDLVPNQKLEDILKAASGYYLVNEHSDNTKFFWQRCSGDLQVENLATGQFLRMPDAVIYMNRNVLESWNRLKRFSDAMRDAMTSVLDEKKGPSSFVEALNKLPNRCCSGANHDGGRDASEGLDVSDGPAQRLAYCVYLCEILSDTGLEHVTVEEHRRFVEVNIVSLIEGHRHFRSPRVETLRLETLRLFETSRDRFTQLFQQYTVACNTNNTGWSGDTFRKELRALLEKNSNSVALVVYQGFFATVARLNSAKVLLRAREAPEEWIRFITADNNYIHIG